MDAGTPGQAATSALSTLASSVTAGGTGALSRLAEGLAAPGEGPLGRGALMEGAAVADGLVAQTALLDKGGELSQLRSAVSATVLSAAAQARARGMAQATSLGGVAAVQGWPQRLVLRPLLLPRWPVPWACRLRHSSVRLSNVCRRQRCGCTSRSRRYTTLRLLW